MREFVEQARKDREARIKHYNRRSDGAVDASGLEPPGGVFEQEQSSPTKLSNPLEAREKNPHPRKYARGGAVGEKAKHHAGRKSRAVGGPMAAQAPDVPSQRFEFGPSRPSPFLKKGGRVERKDGGGNWIAGAIKHKGALHKELGVPEGKKIPEKKLEKAEHSSNPTERKRAHLAETLKGLHKADGGRVARKDGGRAKGKTQVNIIIATGHKEPDAGAPVPPPGAAPAPPPAPPQAMGGAAPAPMGGPPMGSPMMAGPPISRLPAVRAAGGRLVDCKYPAGMKSGKGSGGGQGRLIKAKDYGP